MSFPARYPGRCPACEERIHEGDPIRMTDTGAVHDDCTEAVPVERVETVCQTCWLTSCDCDKEPS